MARHFECIGIPFIDEATTGARFRQIASLGQRHPRVDGGDMVIWTDTGSGAAMIFNTDRKGKILCAQPGFQSGADFSGVTTGFAKDPDGCEFCDPLLATQEIPGSDAKPPLVFHLGNSGLARPHIKVGTPLDLIVTGFAETMRCWRDGAEYHATEGKETAHESIAGFVYDPKLPSPSQYVTTGPVLKAEKQRNSVTNVEFWWLWLGSSIAESFQSVVVREDDLPFGVEVGNIVEASLWACAMFMR